MAQKTQGIQQLLAAEKKAADLIAEARKNKTKRLKQAKEEAKEEIDQYRKELERKFQEKQAQEMGNNDFQQQLNQSTDQNLAEMKQQIAQNKEKVISRMLDLVYDIKPELHENFRSAWYYKWTVWNIVILDNY